MANKPKPKGRSAKPINVQGNIVVSDQVTWSTIWKIGARVVASITGLSVVIAAWLYLGWWVPASRQELINEFMSYDRKVQPRIIEAQSLGLQNKLEILNLNKQSIDREKTDLEIKKQTIKDPAALAIINSRMNNIENDAKATDRAIMDTQENLRKSKQ